MQKYLWPSGLLLAFLCFSSLALINPSEKNIEAKIDNFALLDQNGKNHELYYYSDAKAIVLYIQGNGCPIVRNGLSELKKIRDKYQKKGIVFLMLNANLQDNRESIKKEATEFEIDLPILIDETQLIAESLNIARTAEAIVIDPKNWNIFYRGPVDDRLGYESQKQQANRDYLIEALEAKLKNKDLEEKVVAGKGCLVALPNKSKLASSSISYSVDIAPIIKEKCATCHQEGGIAPFALDSYEQVVGWSSMMREVIRTRRMPPWQADPHYGKFSNDLSLSKEETQKIVHWIEAGTPRGEGTDTDPLKEVKGQDSEWKLGTPDMEIKLNRQAIPATGVLDYRYDQKRLKLDKDMWASAVEFIPGNRKVLHHILIMVEYPRNVKPPIETEYNWLDGVFAVYVPGMDPEIFPFETGRYLPKGTELIFQIHYTTYGRKTSDASRVGIHLTDQKPEKEFLIVGAFNADFSIPPHDKNYKVRASRTFYREVSLYGLFPHMHYRGKSFKYTAKYPDGTQKVLLNVPDYNFNWQRFYLFDDPLVLPAGTRIACEAVFDNSAQNDFNPFPNKRITWGEQSFEEMMIGYMSIHYGKPKTASLGTNK